MSVRAASILDSNPVALSDSATGRACSKYERASVGRFESLWRIPKSVSIRARVFAHELKQPLAAIVMAARTLARWTIPQLARGAAGAGRIIKSANRAAEIIDNIRAMVRKAPVRMTELDVNQVILEILDLLHAETVRNRVAVCISSRATCRWFGPTGSSSSKCFSISQ
jgi:signal transduction histidine kinase